MGARLGGDGGERNSVRKISSKDFYTGTLVLLLLINSLSYQAMPSHQLSLILSLIPRLLLVCTCQLHPFIHSLLSLTEKEEAVELKEREFFYGMVFPHLKIRHCT